MRFRVTATLTSIVTLLILTAFVQAQQIPPIQMHEIDIPPGQEINVIHIRAALTEPGRGYKMTDPSGRNDRSGIWFKSEIVVSAIADCLMDRMTPREASVHILNDASFISFLSGVCLSAPGEAEEGGLYRVFVTAQRFAKMYCSGELKLLNGGCPCEHERGWKRNAEGNCQRR